MVATTYRKSGRLGEIMVGLGLDQIAALDDLAKEQRISRSAVIRQAIDLFLRQNINPVDTSSVDNESGQR